MWKQLSLPNLITLAGLVAALACARFAVEHRLAHAVAALVAAGLCDLFDGLVARRLGGGTPFGARLDSLVDACAFGFAPVVLLHQAGLRTPLELSLLAAFAACAVWRLAYFDTVGLAVEGGARYYTGLPTTYVALVLPLAFLAGFRGAEELRVACDIAAPALALAMVSPVKVPKPGGAWYLVFLALAVGLLYIYIARAGRFGT